MKKLLFAMTLMALTLTSCIKADQVNIIDFDGLTMVSANQMDVTITIENLSAHNITLKDAKFHFTQHGGKLAEMMLAEPVKVPRRSTTAVVIPLKIRVTDLSALMSMSRDPESAARLISASGDIAVKACGIKKKYSVSDVPMSQLLDMIGVDF